LCDHSTINYVIYPGDIFQAGADDRKALTDQLAGVQREFERLKAELVKMMEKYNQQYRKYTDHKLDSKNKMFKTKYAVCLSMCFRF